MKNNDIQPHTKLRIGDVGRYVLLPGDPGRCEKIACYFDNNTFIAQNREFVTFTGTLEGEKVSVCSTGIGGPSTAIAVEELIAVGADTFIRVGTSGSIQDNCLPGNLAIVTGAIRDEGTTLHYMPVEFPAVSDIQIVSALKTAATRLCLPYQIGILQSKDSFYGEIEPERMPISFHLIGRWDAWKFGGAICSEMEISVILILCSIYKKRGGGIMLMAGNSSGKDLALEEIEELNKSFDIDKVIRTSIEGLKVLINLDKQYFE